MGKMLEPGSWELTLFEKNEHFGGTWYKNTYPGVACDIPSHLYTFTWDPNPNWSYYYAYGPEIQKYFEGFVERHGCHAYISRGVIVLILISVLRHKTVHEIEYQGGGD
jgi:cation diffusion facilitator CzcD-associated flavoprotein CzcO